ncbi:unnamed protein product [Closterium sp. NIES-65]|nr:unnamed protein product [Closterium sp. NIES-65]
MQLKPSIYSVLNPTFAFGIFAAWLLVSTQAASRNPFLTLSADSHAEFGNLRSVDAKPPAVHDQPLIGILSQPGDGDGGRAPRVNSKEDLNVSYIAASYVKWVESAGARPVPILYDDPDWLMEKVCALALHKACVLALHKACVLALRKAINGLILPGGGTDLVPGPFFSAVEKLLKMALAANDAGDYFPVQGTCMGMETLTIFFSQDFDILETKAFNAEDSPEALKFTSEEAKRRAYFSWMTPDLLDRIQKEKITMENHESPANPCSKVPSHLSCSKVPSHLSCSKVASHLSCSKVASHLSSSKVPSHQGPISSLMQQGRISSLMQQGRISSLMQQGPISSLMQQGPISSLMQQGPISSLMQQGPISHFWHLSVAPLVNNCHFTDSITSVPLYNAQDGTTVGRFLSNKRLKEFFHILTTSVDRNGTEYVTTIEARDYPIYGTQWHPEHLSGGFRTFPIQHMQWLLAKPPLISPLPPLLHPPCLKQKTAFEWGLPHIPHSAHAVAVCQATANFFVNEARRSTHRPESDEEMDEMLIYNYAPIFSGKNGRGFFEQSYVFSKNQEVGALHKVK